MGAGLEVEGEDEREQDQPAAGVRERPNARKRRGRDPVRDLLLPVLAVTTVVIIIVTIELVRERESTPAAAPVFAPGSYSPIELGSSGGGKPKLGERAPGFQLLDVSGEVVRLDAFRGRPVLVNFWATWCIPCRKETPDLIELQSEWGDQAQVVGVNYSESADAARTFATNYAVNYVLPLDTTGEVTGSYKLTGLPETFFLDGEGVIRDHRIGQLRPDIARCIVSGIQTGEHEPEACR